MACIRNHRRGVLARVNRWLSVDNVMLQHLQITNLLARDMRTRRSTERGEATHDDRPAVRVDDLVFARAYPGGFAAGCGRIAWEEVDFLEGHGVL